jgi:hypothetical protein
MYRAWTRFVSVRIASAILLTASFGVSAVNPPLGQPNPKLAVAGKVYAVLKQSDGGTIIGGDFVSVNGLPRHNLARRGADGQVDPDWRADTDGTVYALAVDGSGSVYAGGRFSTMQGESRDSIARLSSAGLLDPLWHPSITVGGNRRVNAIALDSVSGAIYLAGLFEDVNGVPRTNLAKLTTSGAGTLDANWNPLSGYSVAALAVAPDGSIYVGGQFDNAGGLSRQNIAKLSSTTGAADPSWSADADGSVSALVVDGSGRLYAGGDFDQIGGQVRNGIARLLADGEVDTAWYSFVGNPGYVLAMALSDAGELYVGGAFNPHGGLPDFGNVVKIRDNGSIDGSWMPVTNQWVRAIDVSSTGLVAIGGEFSTVDDELRMGFAEVDAGGITTSASDAELPGKVSAIAVQPNGGTILGGTFLKGDGLARSNLLRIMPGGEVDPIWNPSPNNIVDRVTTDGNDLVYVAGRFSKIGGVQRARLAKLSGAGAGDADPIWGSVQGGYVYAMSLDIDGNLYLGGNFLAVGGVQKLYLARILSGAGLDQTWDPPHDRFVSGVTNTLAGAVDVAYYTSGFPGPTGDVKRISTVNGDVLRLWTLDYPAGIYSNSGALYVFGGFNMIDGIAQGGVARILSDGNVDQSWQVSAGSTHAMCVDSSGNIYLGVADSGLANRVLKVSAADGAIDLGWSHLVNAGISAMATDTDGAILLGGVFDRADDYLRSGFVALRGADSIFVDGFDPAPVR